MGYFTWPSTSSSPETPILLDDGTVNAPAYSFAAQPALGFWRVGTDHVQLAGGDETIFSVFNGGTNDNTIVRITNNGSSTGDQFVHLLEGGVTASEWAAGRDDSDSGAYKISQSSAPGTNDFLKITTAGVVSLGASGGTSAQLINGQLTAAASLATELSWIFSNTENSTATANSALKLRSGGASGGDPYIQFRIPSATDWSVGVDNSDSDSFCIANAASLAGTNFFKISTGGVVTIGTGTATTHVLNTVVGTTVGAAGGASALPATPTGYVTMNINGTDRKIPYYTA